MLPFCSYAISLPSMTVTPKNLITRICGCKTMSRINNEKEQELFTQIAKHTRVRSHNHHRVDRCF